MYIRDTEDARASQRQQQKREKITATISVPTHDDRSRRGDSFARILIPPQIEGKKRYKYPWVPDCAGEDQTETNNVLFFKTVLFWGNHDRTNWQLLMSGNIRGSDKFLLHQKINSKNDTSLSGRGWRSVRLLPEEFLISLTTESN